MLIAHLTIRNFRSIKRCDDIRIEPLQGFVGENNTGKSNILKAINCFLTSGAAGIQRSNFNDPDQPITIEAKFTNLSDQERRRLRPYLIGATLILQKTLESQKDVKTGKWKIETQYHGYQAEPKDWWLSISKIEDREDKTPKWQTIAEQHGILDYVQTPDGKVIKTSYRKGLEKLLAERDDIEYDEPVLGETQALGIQPNLLSTLPQFYLLPAITDYSDEIDRRSSSTVFRRLMGDLSDRIIKADPQYSEVEDALSTLKRLFNATTVDEANEEAGRLNALGTIEDALTQLIAKMMPSVKGVQIEVSIEEPKELFSRGVSLKVDDGVVTDVLDKGHGLQRSVVFGLLQMLIKTSREHDEDGAQAVRPIILGIEEPELYIHPQSQRLIYNVLKEFAGVQGDAILGTNQVIYTTHSPAFVDVSDYERVGIVRKDSQDEGTIIRQCEPGVLGSVEERKGFKLLTSFSLKHNELFFAREIALVEGPQCEIAVIATARKLNRIIDLPDEMGLAVVVTHNKEEIPKFQKILNAFGMKYSVLLELDGKPEDEGKNAEIIGLLNGNVVAKLPEKLETIVGHEHHFSDVFYAKMFFSKPENITPDLEAVVSTLIPKNPNQDQHE